MYTCLWSVDGPFCYSSSCYVKLEYLVNACDGVESIFILVLDYRESLEYDLFHFLWMSSSFPVNRRPHLKTYLCLKSLMSLNFIPGRLKVIFRGISGSNWGQIWKRKINSIELLVLIVVIRDHMTTVLKLWGKGNFKKVMKSSLCPCWHPVTAINVLAVWESVQMSLTQLSTEWYRMAPLFGEKSHDIEKQTIHRLQDKFIIYSIQIWTYPVRNGEHAIEGTEAAVMRHLNRRILFFPCLFKVEPVTSCNMITHHESFCSGRCNILAIDTVFI